MKIIRLLFISLIGFLIQACTINSVKTLPVGDIPDDSHSVIVYGVKLEGTWKYSNFSVQLAEYDLAKQNIKGNCFNFNRTEAFVAPMPGELKYFAFQVPPGYYAYSPFHVARPAGQFLAFEAPAGKIVYVGNFVLDNNQMVTIVRDANVPQEAIREALPGLRSQISLATTTKAGLPSLFVCTP